MQDQEQRAGTEFDKQASEDRLFQGCRLSTCSGLGIELCRAQALDLDGGFNGSPQRLGYQLFGAHKDSYTKRAHARSCMYLTNVQNDYLRGRFLGAQP